MEADLRFFDEVDSTNITLERMAQEGAREGTCVISLCQKKGQGRSGRSFYSPAGGNLYMSLLLRPSDEQRIRMITTMAAVAVVHAVREVFGIGTGIKWVNDIIYDGRKVCGILARAEDIGGSGFHVILGIGINIYEADNVPDDIAGRYGSLMRRRCDISPGQSRELAERLARKVIDCFSVYYEDHADAHIDEYRKYCIGIGKTVEYMSGDSVTKARMAGIDDEGGIVLEKDGVTETFRDGEIRIRLSDM